MSEISRMNVGRPGAGAGKTSQLGDLFTDDELKRMKELYLSAKPGTFARRCAAEVIKPVMDRINAATGQENDATYLAYAAEYAFSKVG